MLYYDELELCNPLGSSRKIHKLGCFYFTLGNLHPKYRSTLKQIQLIALVKNEHVKKYGIDPVLECIINDIKKLESGVFFVTSGGIKTFFGSIATISTDNLGSHCVGGFKEGFRALRPCRQCMATTEEYKTKFHENEFTLRTPSQHNKICDHLEKATDPSYHSTTYGVNRRTPLNSLKYYHTCDFGLPPDVMHDLLEGYVPYLTKLMLKHFIEVKHLFSLDELNSKIQNFRYGYSETKPSIIFPKSLTHDDTDLNQSASKMWTLARYLPLIIGEKIPENDEHWSHYLESLDVLELALAQVVRPDTPAYLQVLLQDHLDHFPTLYPNASVIPMIHFLTHIPRFLEFIGPLTRHWTIRFEAKHQYFKQLASTMGNFINICYSLAMRHQTFQCYTLNSDYISITSEIGPGKKVLVDGTLFAQEIPLQPGEFVHRVNWVKCDGVHVMIGAVMIIEVKDNEEPSFGEVVDIFVLDPDSQSSIKLGLRKLETIQYDWHFHSWVVRKSNDLLLTCFDELASHQVLTMRPARYNADLLQYVTLKYAP